MAWLSRTLMLALAGVLAAGAPASAVLIASGDGSGNTTAPPSDPGWTHVGALNGLTGVYLGDAWVLTANHVGTGPFTVGGITYPAVAGSTRRLVHTPGVYTDLQLFRLVSDPGLATLPIATTSPPLATEALMIGRGRNRGVPYKFTSHDGWSWGAGYAQRWGTNNVSQAAFDLNLLGAPLRALGFSFDDLGGGPPEAIVTDGDSGGAAFVGSNLSGILNARWSFGGQQAQTSVYGNGSYVADLSYYRSQILTLAAERACSNGVDDDGDGLVDLGDPGCSAADDPFETNALVACDDGFDSDGDGLVDWPADPGCLLAISLMENPACDDDQDNDGDGGIDWDGGAGAGAVDPQCLGKPARNNEAPSGGCGLGFELILLAPLLTRLRRST